MGGRERTLEKLNGLAAAAGLTMMEATTLGSRYLLEFALPPRSIWKAHEDQSAAFHAQGVGSGSPPTREWQPG
jgi:hypothetical protein